MEWWEFVMVFFALDLAIILFITAAAVISFNFAVQLELHAQPETRAAADSLFNFILSLFFGGGKVGEAKDAAIEKKDEIKEDIAEAANPETEDDQEEEDEEENPETEYEQEEEDEVENNQNVPWF